MRERGAAGAQDGRVQALQELPGDVDRDVRPRLEVRADRADRDAPGLDAEPVLERPAILGPLERRQLRELRELIRERGDPRVVEPEPVERALVELGAAATSAAFAAAIASPPLADELGRPHERARDALVGERADRGVRGARLALDLLPQARSSGVPQRRGDAGDRAQQRLARQLSSPPR